MSDDLCDLSFRLFPAASIGSDLCDHFMTIDRTFCTFLRNKNILKDFLIVRYHKSKVFAFLISANHFCDCMGNDLCNTSFLPFSSIAGYQRCLHHIPVKSIAGVFFRYKNIIVPAFYFNKSKSFRMGYKRSGNGFLFCNLIFSSFGDFDLAFGQKFI